MRIAVVSDLHLAAEASVCRGGRSERALLQWLDLLAERHDRVVLLGDIWETLAPRRLGDGRAELERAAARWPGVMARISDPAFVYIHGNHDLVAAQVLNSPSEWRVCADGLRLWFTHGHQFDKFSSTANSERAFWAVGWVMRAGLRRLVERLDGVDQVLGGAHRLQARCQVQKRAVTAARAASVDLIVTGHTHLGGVFDHGDVQYLNSGTGAGGRRSCLSIDTATRRWFWIDGKAEARMRLRFNRPLLHSH